MLAMALDWKKIVDNEWTYIPLLVTVCLWSFGIGWVLGWALT
jgi:hypothetical protein